MIPVCTLQQLPTPGAKSALDETTNDGAFVVRHAEGISGFYNQCPHTGAPLNWQPDQFLTIDHRYILCSLHGARFRLTDGLCISGPCIGQALKTLPVVVENNTVYLQLPPTEPGSQSC